MKRGNWGQSWQSLLIGDLLLFNQLSTSDCLSVGQWWSASINRIKSRPLVQNWAAPLKRLLCSRILKLRACGRSSLKEALGPPSEISFLCFAFTTLPLCWYPLFYAKSKSKFSQLACSDNEVKRTDYFGQNLHGTQICWIWQIIRSDSTGGSIFGASTSSSKSLLLSGADWNTILTRVLLNIT